MVCSDPFSGTHHETTVSFMSSCEPRNVEKRSKSVHEVKRAINTPADRAQNKSKIPLPACASFTADSPRRKERLMATPKLERRNKKSEQRTCTTTTTRCLSHPKTKRKRNERTEKDSRRSLRARNKTATKKEEENLQGASQPKSEFER